jgi:hypothetical protein
MKKVYFLILILFFFSCHQAFALDNSMRLTAMYPSTKQNLDITAVELSYLHSDSRLFQNFDLKWYPVLSIGSIDAEQETSLSLGAALGLSYNLIPKLKLFTEGGMLWLENYEFGTRGVAYKDYGGHFQYQAKVGLDYSIRKEWYFGYSYNHMSNGEMYNINPALDTHSLYVVYEF